MDAYPIGVREKAQYLWDSIKGLVQVKPEDEQQVLVRIAAALIPSTFGEVGRLAHKGLTVEQISERMHRPVALVAWILEELTTKQLFNCGHCGVWVDPDEYGALFIACQECKRIFCSERCAGAHEAATGHKG